ncbi:hypothetical protein BD413DRAFT_95996 [Trametes elegans]|nr:hypothetical protein BD413DRAFT_95996 [Trametes elegans]
MEQPPAACMAHIAVCHSGRGPIPGTLDACQTDPKSALSCVSFSPPAPLCLRGADQVASNRAAALARVRGTKRGRGACTERECGARPPMATRNPSLWKDHASWLCGSLTGMCPSYPFSQPADICSASTTNKTSCGARPGWPWNAQDIPGQFVPALGTSWWMCTDLRRKSLPRLPAPANATLVTAPVFTYFRPS